MANGYVRLMVHGRTQLVHQWMAEKALGKPLPQDAEVHHVDFDRAHNINRNLVVCPNAAYHDLIEQRTRALLACGHADWRKCRFCKQYDDPASLYISKSNVHHRSCIAEYYRSHRTQRKEADHG